MSLAKLENTLGMKWTDKVVNNKYLNIQIDFTSHQGVNTYYELEDEKITNRKSL